MMDGGMYPPDRRSDLTLPTDCLPLLRENLLYSAQGWPRTLDNPFGGDMDRPDALAAQGRIVEGWLVWVWVNEDGDFGGWKEDGDARPADNGVALDGESRKSITEEYFEAVSRV